MAGLAAGLVLTIQDGKGKKSNMIINLPPALPNIGRYQAIARNWMDIIRGVIRGKVVYAGVTFGIELTAGAIGDVAEPDSDVEEGAKFIFTTENGFPTSIRVPTFDETKILDGTRQVDLTDGAVENLVEAMIDGIDDDDTVVVNLQDVVDTHGDDVVSLSSALESFQRSRG